MNDLSLNDCHTVIEGRVVKTNIAVKDGKISRISRKKIHALKEIDCGGKLVLPGLIDEHVHFRVPGGEHKEDWRTASLAAIAGGITTVLDMPNTSPALTTRALLEEKTRIVEKDAKIGFGFHFGAANDNLQELENAEGIASINVFMGSSTGNLLVEDEQVLEKIFQIAKERNLVVTVHAEDEQLMKQNFEKIQEKNHARVHNKIRNNAVEARAIEKALRIQEKVGNKLHFLHVSTSEGIALVGNAKKHNKKITCEVTPHHLFLSEQDVERLGNFGKMNPPLRSKKDVKALWKALKQGVVDCIGSDHAPHTVEEKNQEFLKAPSGVPGIETTLPLLLNAASEKKLSLAKIAKLCCENPARIFGLEGKGRIETGFDADLVIVDLSKEFVVRNEDLKTKCKWSPFNGLKLKGVVEKTIVKGNF